jgi:hypothetical protein
MVGGFRDLIFIEIEMLEEPAVQIKIILERCHAWKETV